jgi:hypothetical protein
MRPQTAIQAKLEEIADGAATPRVCLQDGLKLNLNRLARNGFVQSGAKIGVRGIQWTYSYWGGVASGHPWRAAPKPFWSLLRLKSAAKSRRNRYPR